MSYGLQANGFNQVAAGLLGTVIGNTNLLVTIQQPVTKYLNSVHLCAQKQAGTATIEDVLIRVAIFAQQGKFPSNVAATEFSPISLAGTDLGDVGRIYYDNILRLPVNNPLIFDEPIKFAAADQIYVACSIPYAATESGTVTRYVAMSVNGVFESPVSSRYLYR